MMMRFVDMKPGQLFLNGKVLCEKSAKFGCSYPKKDQPFFTYVTLSGLDEDGTTKTELGSFSGEEMEVEYEAVILSPSLARYEANNSQYLCYRGALVEPVRFDKRMTAYYVKEGDTITTKHEKMDSLSPVQIIER